MKPSYPDLYAEVTQQVIAALEAGTTPWICPWDRVHGSVMPANLSTGRPYRGVNVLLLNLQTATRGYVLNRWLTFQQARALGAHVRRGESGTPIVFFKILETDGERRGGLIDGAGERDLSTRKVIPLLRSFTVFNAAQIEGLPETLVASPALPADWSPVPAAETLLARSGAEIRHGGDRAFYRPGDDVIQLPLRHAFDSIDAYYATALHELTHWTGHASRCNRVLSSRAHIEAYAFEELVAEMGAAFLCSHCGIQGELQHASYIASWLEALRNDKRLVFTAASLAQKASDSLIGDQGTPGGALGATPKTQSSIEREAA
jgi:antirestriction protein ArdC